MIDYKYFAIDLPYENVDHAKSIDINSRGVHLECIDGSKVFIRTTQKLIDAKVKSGVKLNDIFPPSKFAEFAGSDAARSELISVGWYIAFGL